MNKWAWICYSYIFIYSYSLSYSYEIEKRFVAVKMSALVFVSMKYVSGTIFLRARLILKTDTALYGHLGMSPWCSY